MKLTTEDKYFFYEKSVQGPDFDIKFINKEFKKFFNKAPLSLREDFGGTGFLCHEWIKQGPKHSAVSIDLDPIPMIYGQTKHFPLLSSNEQKRMKFLLKDVTKVIHPLHDVVVAFNFSYYIFKKREELLTYFKAVKKSLNKKGLFFIDVLGGSDCFTPNTTTTKHPTHHYIWELKKFNAINHNLEYAIHFYHKKQKKLFKNVFTYDWRLWSPPEIMDLLDEAGFKKVHTYLEGDDGKGGGNGKFKEMHFSDFCESYIGYIIAENN